MMKVTLEKVTEDNFEAVTGLSVTPEQERFVAPNLYSLAEAAVTDGAVFWAIYADELPVGFAMLSERPGRYYLWRFMIDAAHQGNGYGKAAMEEIISYVAAKPDGAELYLSYVPGEGSPGPFYAQLGFVDTGTVQDGENEAVLQLSVGSSS